MYPPAAASFPRMALKDTKIGDTDIDQNTTIYCLPLAS